jgi:integrase
MKQTWSVFCRKSGVWTLSYKDAAGKWRQKSLAYRGTEQSQAEAEARAWFSASKSNGTLPSGKTVGDVWQRWLELRRKNPKLAPSTSRDNESILKNHIVPRWASTSLLSLDAVKLSEWVRELRVDRGASTVRNIMNTFSALFQDAALEGWIPRDARNPTLDAGVRREMPEVESDEHAVTIPLPHVQALLDAPAVFDDRRVRYALAVTSGGRAGEIHGLHWEDLHLDDEPPHFRIHRALALKVGERKHAGLSKTKTKTSRRTLVLHPAAADALRWWWAHGWELFMGRRPRAEDPLFPSPRTGKPWRPKSAEHVRDDLAGLQLPTTNGDQPIEFKSFRATFATSLRELGVDEATVGRFLGHASQSTLGRHYTGEMMKADAALVARIPIVWNPPPTAGSVPPVSSEPHNWKAVEPHKTEGENASAPVAQWIEQRFPKSYAGSPEVRETQEDAAERGTAGVVEREPRARPARDAATLLPRSARRAAAELRQGLERELVSIVEDLVDAAQRPEDFDREEFDERMTGGLARWSSILRMPEYLSRREPKKRAS